MNDDEERIQKKPSYALGDDLSLFSIEELESAIDACREEIARLEAELKAKRASIDVANAIFKS